MPSVPNWCSGGHRLNGLGITYSAPPGPFGTYSNVQTNHRFSDGMLSDHKAVKSAFIGRVGAEPTFDTARKALASQRSRLLGGRRATHLGSSIELRASSASASWGHAWIFRRSAESRRRRHSDALQTFSKGQNPKAKKKTSPWSRCG